MKRTYVHSSVILASVLILSIGGRAWGGELPPAVWPGAGSNLSMTRFYTGSLTSVGQFPGKLISLPCDPNHVKKPAARCEQPDHALVVEGDKLIHPLLPGTEEVRKELDSLQFQEMDVTVHGKYYPSTGAILVNRICSHEEGEC